jgi:hypothetical protein
MFFFLDYQESFLVEDPSFLMGQDKLILSMMSLNQMNDFVAQGVGLF